MRYLISIAIMLFASCNNLGPRFSKNADKAERNGTLVKEYTVLNKRNCVIGTGDVWIEKVWNYENDFSKTITNSNCLNIELLANNDFTIQDYHKTYLLPKTEATHKILERIGPGFRGIGRDELWFQFELRDSFSSPDTIAFKIFHDTTSATLIDRENATEIGELVLIKKEQL